MKLLPCPFCSGSKSDIDTSDENFYRVACAICFAEGPWAPTEPQAIKLWNNRGLK